MAFSDSIKRAQTVKQCDLCQEENSKWRCLECNMCLCEKCKTIHLKIPATARHQIVTLGTQLKDVQRKMFTDNILCQEHPEEKTILFCRSCKSLICQDCISSNHENHKLDSLKSALDQKLANLKGILAEIDDKLKCCRDKTTEVQNIKSSFNIIFDESLSKIKQQEQELVEKIRKYSQLLQENVEKERNKVNNTLLMTEEEIHNKEKNLEDQRDKINAIIMSSQGGDIFKFKANMLVEDLKFDSFPNEAEYFIPGTTSIKQFIQEMFGSLKKLSVSSADGLPEMKLEVFSTLTTDLPLIHLVEPLSEISAWINMDNILRKINIKDNNMPTSKELSSKVFDMTTTSNGELLFTVVNDLEIKLLKHSGEIASFLSVAPLNPRGIHVTKDSDIIVGVMEPGSTFTPTDQSQRAVIVYGMDGKQKHKYQYDKEGQRLFTDPYRITTNSNQDIIVVDKTSGITGRVVSLNKNGDLQWIYDGQSKINISKQFDPRGIVTTSLGYIIVNDYRSHALHVLTQYGEILTYKVLSDMKIERPWGLGIDNKGRLWLGCDAGGKRIGAKLYILFFMQIWNKAILKQGNLI